MSEGRFWAWSGAVYRRTGVAEMLLRLQDEDGLDINSVLFCYWCAAEGREIGAGAARRMRALVDDWSRPVVQPVRTARRNLKATGAITPARAEALKRSLQAIELELEEVHQDLLEDVCGAGGCPPAQMPIQPEFLARTNLERYFSALERDDTALAHLRGLPIWNLLNRAALPG